MNTRTCTRCHQTKPTSEYSLVPRTNQPRCWCKQCSALASQQYRETLSPEQRHERSRTNGEYQYSAQRATLDTATRYGNTWTQRDDDFLHNNHKTMTNLELARKLNRSHSAIAARKHKLDLRKTNRYN